MPFAFFFLQIIVLFFTSRNVSTELYYALYRILKNKHAALYTISLLYFPGTVIHEISHFFAAAALFLRVRNLTLFPEISDHYVKLGSVEYEKQDYVRGLLVGIAPFFVGLIIFYIIAASDALLSGSMITRVILVYFFFVISSTMFSSKKDLVDLLYVLPLILIAGLAIYILHIDIKDILDKAGISRFVLEFVVKINYYLLISVVINAALFIGLKLINKKNQ